MLGLAECWAGQPPARREVEVLRGGPAKVLANHLVELFIERNKKLTQLRHDCRIHIRVGPTLGLCQTLLKCFIPHAVEAFGLVEVEVVWCDVGGKPQKLLYLIDLCEGISY